MFGKVEPGLKKVSINAFTKNIYSENIGKRPRKLPKLVCKNELSDGRFTVKTVYSGHVI